MVFSIHKAQLLNHIYYFCKLNFDLKYSDIYKGLFEIKEPKFKVLKNIVDSNYL